MSRVTLCDPPAGWKERIKELSEQAPPFDGTILLGVELALELAWFLNYRSETPLVVPALLSGTPMYGVTYTPEQRLAIANVRQILPYSSSSAWRTDLAAYRLLPAEWRHYDFPLGEDSREDIENIENQEEPNEERDDWEKRLLCIARKPDALQRHKLHNQLYQRCLTTRLSFHRRNIVFAVADKPYVFRAELTNGEREEISITFPQELLDTVKAIPVRWFDFEQERVRESIIIDFQRDLVPIAQFFDEVDKDANRPSEQWQDRLGKIEYRSVSPDGQVCDDEKNALQLDGFHHAAGMVASGKSTLAFLLAGFIAKEHPQKRITLVVGDNQTVLKLVNQLNNYFRKDPVNDTPVAVPLMGRRSRNKQLRDLHGTADWQTHWAQGKAHWGERFLSMICPLQGLIPPDDIARSLHGQTIQPGQEPCASLKLVNENKTGRSSNKKDELTQQKFLCPLYARCPVHRATHDMMNAPIWITTPQAMTRGSLPPQAETRPVHIGEIVYEQSDIVVVDEADAVMGVLDEIFAQEEDLTNGKRDKAGGIYDRVGDQTERFVISVRAAMTGGQLRWSQAQRGGQNACQILLSLLNEDSLPFLKEWIKREYFTPYVLFYRLSRRLAGLPENASHDESTDAKALANECMEPFEQLFGRTVPDALNPHRVRAEHERRQQLQPAKRDEAAYDLWQLLRDIDVEGDRIFHAEETLVNRCKTWIMSNYPEWPERAQKLRTRLEEEARTVEEKAKTVTGKETKSAVKRLAKGKKKEAEQVDTLDQITYRLLFALAAGLLDRHTYIILAEWSRRTAPEEDDIQPHQNTPAILRDVLPLPPIGRQFGTYYSSGDSLPDRNPNRLSFLSYTNLGRYYLLHFHELFSDLRQCCGPNVLALSGTSYMPDAVRLHLGSFHTKPQGLLLPEKVAVDAIGKSEFTFLPLRDEEGLPIRISGAKEGAEKILALQSLARKLAGYKGGYLARELSTLERLGQDDSTLWADRSRILLLVNSYDQARIAATTLQDAWPEAKERIFYLSRVEGENNDMLGGGKLGSIGPTNALNRPDIETFGTQTNGRILVAPMSAIGRGYNILNKNGKTAAFGALYFLIRPYPHPEDMTALAREMNRRTLDWADKEDFGAWNAASLQEKFQNLRREASRYWDTAQHRKYWSTLHDYSEWDCAPRKDLAAYTAGLLVQAAGRLLRGGVPFRAYFVDAAFALQAARHSDEEPIDTIAIKDAPLTSLLAAVIVLMRDFVCADPIAEALYAPLADALCVTQFRDDTFPFDDHWNKKGEKIVATKAKRSPVPTPDALPARFDLNPQAFDGMTAATLKRPYAGPLWQFTNWLEAFFKRIPQSRRDENGRTIRPQPPYRLLNDALNACAPTIVHGFEWYKNTESDKGYRMLVVGKSSLDGDGLAYPSEDEIANVMRLWLKQWGERPWLKNIIQGEGKQPWEALCTALAQPPDTQWEIMASPKELLETGDGLRYEVIPSLVATLLHETESCIGPNQYVVHWRRMQESNSNRYCLVSEPIPVEFLDTKDRTGTTERKSGYFSYKIEIALQTQAGRSQPWLYLSLHCMRYADLPLSSNKRGNEVTILIGANQSRLQNWKVDSTLIRLKATANANVKNRNKVLWLEDLPPLLAELKARPLVKPGDLYENPRLYWRDSKGIHPVDEYYVLHTEGYRYNRKKHPVLTGFSLMERAQVLGSLCQGALCGVITPDTAMRADARCFEDHNKPTALHTFSDLTPSINLEKLSNEEKNASSTTAQEELRLARVANRDTKVQSQRQQNQPVINKALECATRGKILVIACLHREADTFDVLRQALLETFQLNEQDEWPAQVRVLNSLIPSLDLVQPLEEIENMRRKDDEVARWRTDRIGEWQKLLQNTFGRLLDSSRCHLLCHY